MTSVSALSMQVPVRHPTLISLDLPLTPPISNIGKRKKILTCTPETTRAKLERLCSARLTHRDPTIMTRRAKALIKANELVILLAPKLTTIKHVISQIKLISIIMFASYSKHVRVSKQHLNINKPLLQSRQCHQ
jgi:hypothetical protein